jgi:glycosyltransferase involved in cell wall biosynthesis
MSSPKISVCIPAYEMNRLGAVYLDESFTALDQQDFSDFEVVVSDQSNDLAVHELCKRWSGRLNIKHVWNLEGARRASTNVNRALDEASGDILKVLFQDDYLCLPDALTRVYSSLSTSSSPWLLSGSGVTHDGHTIERRMVPTLSDKLHFGKNTVSSPSVLAIRKECPERFDPNLVWLMDVEYYKRLWTAYGDPVILSDISVANRIHKGQVSAGIDRALQAKELDYIWRTHASTTSLSGKIEYARRRLKTLISS